jgi:hypothetical protein
MRPPGAKVSAESGPPATYAEGEPIDIYALMHRQLQRRIEHEFLTGEEIMCDDKEEKYVEPRSWRKPQALRSRPKPKFYVAVVTRGFTFDGGDLIPSAGRPAVSTGGDWASFAGTVKAKVIEQALEAARKWERGSPTLAKYTVLVGELTEAAYSKPQFETIDIATGKKTGGTSDAAFKF